jgi:CubicO group peptidase (beta-lactamase class C family)
MTLGDGAKFAGMLAGEGTWNGVRVLKPETVRAMTTNTLAPGLFFEPGVRWGIGIALYGETDAYPCAPGSFGWSGYYGNKFWVDPARKLFAVYMFNVVGGHKEDVRRLIEREIYAGLDA